jgi:hypothetical protein
VIKSYVLLGFVLIAGIIACSGSSKVSSDVFNSALAPSATPVPTPTPITILVPVPVPTNPVFTLGLNFVAAFDRADLVLAPAGTTTGAFTIEAWVQLSALPAAPGGYIFYYDVNGVASIGFYVDNTGLLTINNPSGVCGVPAPAIVTATTPLVVGTKYHVAFSDDGVNGYFFINGNLDATVLTSTQTVACPILGGSIGADPIAGNVFPGIIDDVRVSDIARYTATFTAPVIPAVADPNTLILFNADAGTVTGAFTGGTFTLGGTPAYVLSPFP